MGRNEAEDIKVTGSIHDRLKQLQKNGNEGWRRNVKKHEKNVTSSLHERLNLLKSKEDSWKVICKSYGLCNFGLLASSTIM